MAAFEEQLIERLLAKGVNGLPASVTNFLKLVRGEVRFGPGERVGGVAGVQRPEIAVFSGAGLVRTIDTGRQVAGELVLRPIGHGNIELVKRSLVVPSEVLGRLVLANPG